MPGSAVRSRFRVAFLAVLAVWASAPAFAAETAPAGALRFDCVIDPSKTVALGSSVTGLLEEVTVARGDFVAKGQVVARLQGRVEAASVELLRARAESMAEIEGQRARARLARQKYERTRALVEKRVVAQQLLDEHAAELEVAERALGVATLSKRLAELELARAIEVEKQRTIFSPIDGWVAARLLSAGEFVHQEAQILSLAQLDPLYVEAFVPVRWRSAFEVGMIGHVLPDEPIGGRREARVIVVDRVFDASSGTFGVRLELPNPGGRLPAGQRCQVEFDRPTN